MTDEQKPRRYEDDLEAQERHRKYREQLQHLQWEREPLLLVLRGHLYIEQQLNYLLSHRVPPQQFEDVVSWGFMRKVKLARSLGIISPEVYAASKLLNKYRNLLAHHLGATVGQAEANDMYDLLDKDGIFKGSNMRNDSDPMVTLSRCIRTVHALYDGEILSLQVGKRFRVKLGPWATHEFDKDTFAEEQRAQYKEARRLEKLLDESPEARAEMKQMVDEADRIFREKYGDMFESIKDTE